MNQITHQHASQALVDYIESICPHDAHIHVTMRGTWVSGNVPATSLYKSDVTTCWTVVRAFTYNGVTYWTRENFAHDNGIRCALDVLTKPEFLQAIRS